MRRKWTTLITTLAVALMANGSLAAQEQDGSDRSEKWERGGSMRGARAPDPEKMISGISRRLELDEVQVQQVRNIIDATKPEFAAMRERGRANYLARRELDQSDVDYDAKLQQLASTRQDLQASSRELRSRIRTEINAILTPEQQAKFSELEGETRRGGRRHRGHTRESEEIG